MRSGQNVKAAMLLAPPDSDEGRGTPGPGKKQARNEEAAAKDEKCQARTAGFRRSASRAQSLVKRARAVVMGVLCSRRVRAAGSSGVSCDQAPTDQPIRSDSGLRQSGRP